MAPPNDESIEFVHRFDLENQKQNEGCSHDNVTIYDNINRNPLWWRGTFCGSDAPASMMSQTNKIRIELMSDDVAQFSGFEIRFTAINLNFGKWLRERSMRVAYVFQYFSLSELSCAISRRHHDHEWWSQRYDASPKIFATDLRARIFISIAYLSQNLPDGWNLGWF